MVQSQSVDPFVSLSAPVGHLLRPTIICASEDTIQRSVAELRRNDGGLLPIVTAGRLVGVVTESSLASVLGNGTDLLEACTMAMTQAVTIAPYASGAEALRLLSDSGVATLVVVDDADRVLGLVSASDLFPRRRVIARPEPVGGMATPFGVYLTSGGLNGGASLWAIVGTGATMFSLLLVGSWIATVATNPISKSVFSDDAKVWVAQALALALFMLFMRLIPLSGIHGAEHMVVHAMERGEDLTPEVVARMPRVHPRCGTNLAVGMFIFLGIFKPIWVQDDDIRLLVAVIATLFLWKPLGSFAQQYITTKKPTQKQLRSGIKAANELIEKFSVARSSTASIPQRLWNSGMLHVISGSFLALGVLKLVSFLFHFSIPGL